MIPAHSTVPRWPVEPPGIDPSGRSYGVVAFGVEGAEVAAEWVRQIAASGAPCWSVSGASLEELDRLFGAATVGMRLMLAGPELEVLAVQARAFAAGLMASELTAYVTATSERLIYCVHCRVTTSAAAAVEELAICGGCGRQLLVAAHLSRERGSYLGLLADVEAGG